MGISLREAWSIIHGVGFGAALILLFPVVIAGLFILGKGWIDEKMRLGYLKVLAAGAWTAAVLAWLTDIVGSYIPYVWYRARPPQGTTSLLDYPRSYLLSVPHLAAWESFGMEWKEHLGWIVPILCTASAYIISTYGMRLINDTKLRKTVMMLLIIAFVASVITGLLAVFITKLAPVR
jgi:hypothetical protein